MDGDEERGRCTGEGASDVDCMEAVRQLYVYLDGELTEERRLEISVHLDECGPCADAAGFEAELRAVISSRCKDRVPDSLIDRVAAAIAAEEARGPVAGQA
ncbi:MAG TPA: mycothiol system anti-sigma-R factor [Acidimicrobiales bacterium]|nr:mycothiol system anti-sigma-R factor [Acidimicrobiales bacterium]